MNGHLPPKISRSPLQRPTYWSGSSQRNKFVNDFTSAMKRIAESTVRRLSLYLGFLEDIHRRGTTTVSSEELAKLGGTTSAQVRKDLSRFGSFGKRGLGYSVAELLERLRQIMGLERRWRVCIIGAGKIGAALAQYEGFAQRGFDVVAVYDSNSARVGESLGELPVRDVTFFERDAETEKFDIAVLAIPARGAQKMAERVARAGVAAILNFVPGQITAPPKVAMRTVNMAMELEALSFALTNRE
ncbi:MAG: redox-sensing transcriptional repressor Rex [Gemmatimonadaceae bacterium]